MKRFAILVALLLFAAPAQAEIQKSGAEAFPGKFMVGVNPIGLQVNFSAFGTAAGGVTVTPADYLMYKMNLNFAGLVANLSKVSLWLGGEVNVGGREYVAFIEPGIFLLVSLEKLVQKIPLVPMIRAGFSGPIYVPYGFAGAIVGGAFQVKVGGGAYYFLTKNVGLGAETNFGFGPGFAKPLNAVVVSFAGYWDFSLGAKFAF
jgi:hypothetical protein